MTLKAVEDYDSLADGSRLVWKFDVKEKDCLKVSRSINRWVEKICGRCGQVPEGGRSQWNSLQHSRIYESNSLKLAGGHRYITDYELEAFTEWSELSESSIPG